MKMRVDIANVKSNPFRDFEIDPISEEQVAKLVASVKGVGQFGAVPVRPHPTQKGLFEQASGHHTLAAMRAAGVTEVNVEARERSDNEMVHLMALENLTQRQDSASAQIDAVAAEAFLLARETLVLHDSVQNKSTAKQREHVLKDGPGRDSIFERINAGTAGTIMPERVVTACLGSLKASGKMAEIMQKALASAEEITQQRRAAAEAQIRAEEDAEKRKRLEAEEAKRREREEAEHEEAEAAVQEQAEVDPAYDVHCMSAFRKPAQERAFREVVLSKNGLRFIPKEKQHDLARHIRAEIDEKEKKRGMDLGSTTVKELVNEQLRKAMGVQRDLDQEERDRLLREKDRERVMSRWGTVRRGLQQAESALVQLSDEEKNWSYSAPFPVDMDAVNKLRGIGKRFDALAKKLTGL